MPDLFLVTCRDLPEPDHDAEPRSPGGSIVADKDSRDGRPMDYTGAR
jgi:hypothetical protein